MSAQESTIKYCTVVQPCGQAIMVAVPEQVLPTPPIQPSTQPQPSTPYPGDSPQRPSPIYPPTALQLSLMESESRVAAAAAQSGGNGQGSEVTSAGLPEAAAAAPPAVEAAGPAGHARRVIQIDVDATSSGVAAALVHWHAEDGSRQSTPVQVHVSWSPVASPQHALRDTAESGSGLSSDKDAGRAGVESESAGNSTRDGDTAALSVSEEAVALIQDSTDSADAVMDVAADTGSEGSELPGR